MKKYSLYAIGEIFLVVIGILIALQVNNWNQKRLENEKEKTYLNNIKQDLLQQINAMDDQILFEKKFEEVATTILKHYYENSRLTLDTTFFIKISTLTARKTFTKIDPTFTDLISSGNISLINSDSIKSELIKYYQELERIELIIQNNNTYMTDAVFVPIVLKLGALNRIELHQVFQNHRNEKRVPRFFDKNNNRLIDIAKKQLSKEENELLLINAINIRNDVANNHLSLLKTTKKATQRLLNLINRNQ